MGLFFDKFPIWVFLNRGFSYLQFGSFFPRSNFIFSPTHTLRAIAANTHRSKLKPECALMPYCSLWAERGGLGPLGEHLRTCHSFLSPSSWQPQKPQMAPETPFRPPLPAFGSQTNGPLFLPKHWGELAGTFTFSRSCCPCLVPRGPITFT